MAAVVVRVTARSSIAQALRRPRGRALVLLLDAGSFAANRSVIITAPNTVIQGAGVDATILEHVNLRVASSAACTTINNLTFVGGTLHIEAPNVKLNNVRGSVHITVSGDQASVRMRNCCVKGSVLTDRKGTATLASCEIHGMLRVLRAGHARVTFSTLTADPPASPVLEITGEGSEAEILHCVVSTAACSMASVRDGGKLTYGSVLAAQNVTTRLVETCDEEACNPLALHSGDVCLGRGGAGIMYDSVRQGITRFVRHPITDVKCALSCDRIPAPLRTNR